VAPFFVGKVSAVLNFIHTSLQRGVSSTEENISRFNGFNWKPLKRLLCEIHCAITSLKRGVNER
jgi:hypothetical protein